MPEVAPARRGVARDLVPTVELLAQPRYLTVYAARLGERVFGQLQVSAYQGGGGVPQGGGEVLQDGLRRLPRTRARITRKGRAYGQGRTATHERLQEPVRRHPVSRRVEAGHEHGGDARLGHEHDPAPDQERGEHR